MSATSEIAEAFNAKKQCMKIKKTANQHFSTELLEKNDIQFESKNNGIHLVVDAPSGKIDFWPSTGLWQERKGNQRSSRGVARLLHYINQKQREADRDTGLIGSILKH